MTRTRAILVLATVATSACSTDAPDLQIEVDRLDRAAARGVATVRQALADPSLQFSNFGVGVEAVDVAGRSLRALAADDRVPPATRVAASLAAARAYDDLTITFETTRAGRLTTDSGGVLEDILEEKALPARAAAREAYIRTRALACRTELAEPALMLEILDGVARYVSEDAVTEPCPQ